MSKTIEQVRDEVAVMMGWMPTVKTSCNTAEGCGPEVVSKSRAWVRRNSDGSVSLSDLHPAPSSIDSIALLMPSKGWKLICGNSFQTGSTRFFAEGWKEGNNAGTSDVCTRGATEYEARLKMLHAVLSVEIAE